MYSIGRSLSSCKHAFSVLLGRTGSIYDVLDPPISHSSDKRRGYPYDAIVGNTMSSNSPTIGGRPIHPRPPYHQIVEHSSGPVGYRQPATGLLERQQQQPPGKRKRGRPSKAETQQKTAEAAARGEVYYPQSRKVQRPVPTGALAISPAASEPSLGAPPPISARSSDANVAYRGMSSDNRPGPSSTYGSTERDVLMTEPGDHPSASSSQAARDLAPRSPREPSREIVHESPREPARGQSEPERKESIESDGEQQLKHSRRHSQERYQEQHEKPPDQRHDMQSYRAPQSPRD